MSEPLKADDARWDLLRERLGEFQQRIDAGFVIAAQEREARLQARTREWAQSVPAEDPDAWFEVLSFNLSEELYAIGTEHIASVLPLPALTPLPNTPPFVLGIVNVRGHIVSVLDLRVLFELPVRGLADQHLLVIVQSPLMQFGLLIDRVQGITRINRDSLQSGLANLTGRRANYLLGVTAEQCTVLDGARLLGDPSLRIVSDE